MKPVRIGILGCARIAKAALLDVRAKVPEIDVAAVASRDGARAAAYAAEHGIAQSYGAYEDLLADETLDAIYNPLPNSLHAAWSIRALEAGRAVLCEKPLAANAEEAQQIVDAAARTGSKLVEAFHYRYHPVAELIGNVVRSGSLGRVRTLDAGLRIPGSLLQADNIRFQADLAGGATMDVGAYCINALRFVTDAEPTVRSAEASLFAPDIDGAMKAVLAFPDDVTARFDCSLQAETLGAWLNIEGDEGVLQAQNPFLPQLGHSVTVRAKGGDTTATLDRTTTYVYQARAFADVVRHDAPVLTTGADGVANMRVIDAVYRAAGLSPRG